MAIQFSPYFSLIASVSRKLLIFSCLYFNSLAFVWAESPEQAFQGVVDKMKASRDASVLADFVHWPSAFATVSPKQRVMLGVNDPKEFAKYYKSLLSDPASVLREQMTRYASALPADQQEVLKARMEPMVKKAAGKFEGLLSSVESSEFRIKKSEIEGDSATVSFLRVSGVDEIEEKVDMIKVGDRWLITSPAAFSGH